MKSFKQYINESVGGRGKLKLIGKVEHFDIYHNTGSRPYYEFGKKKFRQKDDEYHVQDKKTPDVSYKVTMHEFNPFGDMYEKDPGRALGYDMYSTNMNDLIRDHIHKQVVGHDGVFDHDANEKEYHKKITDHIFNHMKPKTQLYVDQFNYEQKDQHDYEDTMRSIPR